MSRGKYKKKKQVAKKTQEIMITSEQLYELPGNIIPDYCFTEEAICDKIDVVTHKCISWSDPESHIRMDNLLFYGCAFSPTLIPEKVDKRFSTVTGRKSKKKRVGKVASRTSGKTKGGNCVASDLQKYCTRSSRAYKHPEYAAVMNSLFKRR
jgi:hypothetical protein